MKKRLLPEEAYDWLVVDLYDGNIIETYNFRHAAIAHVRRIRSTRVYYEGGKPIRVGAHRVKIHIVMRWEMNEEKIARLLAR